MARTRLFDPVALGRTRAFSPAAGTKRVGLVFSGGPAPGANAVISAAALTLLKNGCTPVGLYDGFKRLIEKEPGDLKAGRDFVELDYATVMRSRQQGGSLLRSARANPAHVGDGAGVKKPTDLGKPENTKNLDRVLDAAHALGLEALITIGGDDTLKTSFWLNSVGLPTVHVPKTIDNDYFGIDWTFGYFSAIERARQDILTYNVDAETSGNFFLLELMGRKAGWYGIGAAVAGDALSVVSAEDVPDGFRLADLADKFTSVMAARHAAGLAHGTLVITEGLFYKLAEADKPQVAVQAGHGHVELREAKLADRLAPVLEARFKERTGRKTSVKTGYIGYTTRCVQPTAFDILLGSQLGRGGAEFVLAGKTGHMVSVEGQFKLTPRNYDDLMDTNTWLVANSFVAPESDFHALADALAFDARFLG